MSIPAAKTVATVYAILKAKKLSLVDHNGDVIKLRNAKHFCDIIRGEEKKPTAKKEAAKKRKKHVAVRVVPASETAWTPPEVLRRKYKPMPIPMEELQVKVVDDKNTIKLNFFIGEMCEVRNSPLDPWSKKVLVAISTLGGAERYYVEGRKGLELTTTEQVYLQCRPLYRVWTPRGKRLPAGFIVDTNKMSNHLASGLVEWDQVKQYRIVKLQRNFKYKWEK